MVPFGDDGADHDSDTDWTPAVAASDSGAEGTAAIAGDGDVVAMVVAVVVVVVGVVVVLVVVVEVVVGMVVVDAGSDDGGADAGSRRAAATSVARTKPDTSVAIAKVKAATVRSRAMPTLVAATELMSVSISGRDRRDGRRWC